MGTVPRMLRAQSTANDYLHYRDNFAENIVQEGCGPTCITATSREAGHHWRMRCAVHYSRLHTSSVLCIWVNPNGEANIASAPCDTEILL